MGYVTTETRGPQGGTYRAVVAGNVDALLSCLDQFGIVDQPDVSIILGQLVDPSVSGTRMGAWVREQIAAGRGVVLSLPPTPPGMPSTLDQVCEPRPDFSMTLAVLATDSLNQARSFAAGTQEAVVIREPRDGWLEVQRAGLSWGWLAAAGAIVVGAGYLIFRR